MSSGTAVLTKDSGTLSSTRTDGWARLRLNPVARKLVAMQAAVLGVALALAPIGGVSLVWETGISHGLLLALLFGVWAWYCTAGYRPKRAHVPEALLAMALLLLFTNIGGPAQYVGVALALPLVDPWLAAADAALGIYVPAIAAWTTGFPLLGKTLALAYSTLLPQFVMPPVVLGLFYRNRETLWEFLFHFHVCLVATLLGSVFLPTACPFLFYGDFPQIFEHGRFIQHFETLRSGAGFAVRYDNIDGLISIPSFHTAGGLMVTWAFRHHRLWLVTLAVVNVLLIAATVLSGTHYAIDVLVTGVLFLASLGLWRVWGRRGLS